MPPITTAIQHLLNFLDNAIKQCIRIRKEKIKLSLADNMSVLNIHKNLQQNCYNQ